MIGPTCRARSCRMTLRLFSKFLSLGAMTKTGRLSSTSASTPCFISPAMTPSECMSATSLTFKAASIAVA